MTKEEGLNCAFCGRPRRLALYLVTGPGGVGICDLCVLEARSREKPVEAGAYVGNCSFCGRPADDVHLMLAKRDAAICEKCIANCTNIIDEILPPESEFLSEKQELDTKLKIEELKLLAILLLEHFNVFRKSFKELNMDWSAYNLLAQTIAPLKSKAGLMKLDRVSDLMWELESAFKSIRFDDIEANRHAVERLAEFVSRLTKVVNEL